MYTDYGCAARIIMINHQVTLDFTDIMYLHLKVCLNMARQPVTTNGAENEADKLTPTRRQGGSAGF